LVWGAGVVIEVETQLWAVGLILVSTVVGAFGSLFFKKGADDLSLNLKSLASNWRLALGFVFYLGGASLFIFSLKGGELSVLYPIVSFSYVWVSFLSIKFLGETMNRLKWLGVLSIVVGVGLIGLGGV